MKCDLQRPGCSQCLNTGRHCPGYHRATVFLPQGNNHVSENSSKPRPSTPENVGRPPSCDRRDRRAASVQLKRQVHPNVRLTAQVNNQHIFRDLFAAEFLRIYLLTSECCPQTPLTWLQLVFNVPTEGTALDSAMAAVVQMTQRFLSKAPGSMARLCGHFKELFGLSD